MPDFGVYIGWNPGGILEEWYRESDRADSIALAIGHRGIAITLDRSGTALDAQNVLLAPVGVSRFTREFKNDTGAAAKEQLLLVCAPDADIRRGDRFSYNASPAGRLNYEINRVERGLYAQLQCYAEEVQ